MSTTTTPLTVEEFTVGEGLASPSANSLYNAMIAAVVEELNRQLATGVSVRQLCRDLRAVGLSKDVGYCLLDAAEQRGLPIGDAAAEDEEDE